MAPTIQMAMDLHRQGRLAEAERLYRSVLAASPRQFEAHHFFGILKLQQGNLPEALTLIARAVEINPSSLDTRSNLVAVLLNLGRNAEAIEHCNKILAVKPSDASALYHCGLGLAQSGRHAEALAMYDRALAIKPDYVNALFNRAGSLAGLGRQDEAIAAFDKLLKVAPRHPDALCNRGTILARRDRDTEAMADFEQALAIAPDHVNALTNRGIVLKKLLRPQEALASVERALAIHPNHVEAHVNRGNVLIDLNRPEEALASFERALALAAGHSGALTNKAFALHALGRYPEALQSCEAALQGDPALANAYLIRGHTLAKLDRPADAAGSYEQALATDPDEPFAFGAALMAHRAACNWSKVDAMLPAVLQAITAGKAVIPPFNLLGLPVDPQVQLQCAANFIRQRLPPAPAALPRRSGSPSGRIRLGYVSCDFRRHPVSYLVADLFERHDRARFEVFGISYGRDDGSDERRRIAGAVDAFHDVYASNDRDAAALIERLQIDIAIDLAGHTDSSRPGILRYRPAPVQVSYLGYTGTIGADFLDYIIGDAIALPFDLQPGFTEKIVQLPDSFMVNDTTKAIAPQPPSRQEAGLPKEGFVFCCFNNSYKISPAVFGVWLRLLAGVERSVLWLSQMNARAVENLQAAASAAGVDPARIVFAPRVPEMADHLARQRRADLFLDTFDYNAHATANDALWAGLPLLTCAGSAFPGRVAASLLHAAGLRELVTSSLAEYEEAALSLARDPERLRAIRHKLAANRLTHSLFDIDRSRRHLEAAYVRMLEAFRRGEAPQSFRVDSEIAS